MKYVIKNYYSNSHLEFFEVWEAPADAVPPQTLTASQVEDIRPRALGSNEALVLMEDEEWYDFLEAKILEGYYRENRRWYAPNVGFFTSLTRYCIVNMTKGLACGDDDPMLYILPGEDPHAYKEVVTALEEAIRVRNEHNHMPGLFRLVPVDLSQVEAELKTAGDNVRREEEEWA